MFNLLNPLRLAFVLYVYAFFILFFITPSFSHFHRLFSRYSHDYAYFYEIL